MLKTRPGASAQGGWRTLAPWFVSASLILGGASAPGSTATLFLYLITVLVIVYAVVRRPEVHPVIADRGLLGLAAAFVALAFTQLIPLPPSIWAGLPGREVVEEGHALAGLDDAWHPLSVHPQGTTMSLLALFPAAAIALLFWRTSAEVRPAVSSAVLVLAIVSVAIGLLQVTTGTESALYFHSITNWGLAVGFFANANHLSTLLLISLPVFAALLRSFASRAAPLTLLAVVAIYSIMVIIGIYLTGSFAGAGIFVPVACASALLLFRRISGTLVLAAGAAMIGVGLIVSVVHFGGLATFEKPGDELNRSFIAGVSQLALWAGWPVGSGLGTYPTYLPWFEEPAAVAERYINHAHNDYLEFAIETGGAGVLLIIGFVSWWLLRSAQAWRRGDVWQRAASIILGVVLVHSTVDYPLRTPAILVVFTFYALVLASVSGSTRTARVTIR
jgi:hypothetical protein